MIVLTRLDGQRVGINDEQLERVEEAPTTVLTLVNGNRYTVLESLDEVLEAILRFRAEVLVRAGGGATLAPSPPAERRPGRVAHLVSLPDPDDPGEG